MDNIKIDTLLDSLLLELAGCPSLVAKKALEKAVRYWYRDTRAWNEKLGSFITEGDVSSYVITPPGSSYILEIVSLTDQDGGAIKNSDWSFIPPRQIVFSKPQQEGIKITPKVILSPTVNFSEIPCDHATRWADDWSFGALWYLRMQVGMPWYDINESRRQEILFKKSIIDNKLVISSGYKTEPIRVTPYFDF